MQITNIFGIHSSQVMAVHRASSGRSAVRAQQARRSLERNGWISHVTVDLQRGSGRAVLLTGAVLLGLSGGLGLHHPQLLPGLLAILLGVVVLSAALVRRLEVEVSRVLEAGTERSKAEVPFTLAPAQARGGARNTPGAEQRVILARASLASMGRSARQHLSVQETRALEPARLSA